MVSYFAEDLMPPGPDDDGDFGMPRWMLREISLMAVQSRASARAAVLRLLLARLAELVGSPWARLRAELESRGVIDLHCRDGGPPPPGRRLRAVVVSCCPRTGPPAGRAVAFPASGGALA
jgi:hypothetical protein